MSDYVGEQALADPATGAQGILYIGIDADRTDKPYPREFVTLGLVAFCLSFWTIVVWALAH